MGVSNLVRFSCFFSNDLGSFTILVMGILSGGGGGGINLWYMVLGL